MDSADCAINTEGLTKVYKRWFRKGTTALDGVSIQVPRGSIFGFLGPNGAGKTTTIKMLMDLVKPTGGHAWVLGCPATDVNVKERIGFLPDSPAFSPQLTALEFLNICAKLLRIPSEKREKRVAEVLEEVQMAEHAKEKIGSFSRGMMQRIGVAQAILNNPDLLVLDEPLLGLDPFGRQQFKQIILAQQKHGTSVFFSSHILSDVEEICDRIAILNKGHLLCAGTLEELLHSGGASVVIRPGHDDLFLALAAKADSFQKSEDGTRTLQFNDFDQLRAEVEKMCAEHPDAMRIEAGREHLETFFFRTLETHNQNLSDDRK